MHKNQWKQPLQNSYLLVFAEIICTIFQQCWGQKVTISLKKHCQGHDLNTSGTANTSITDYDFFVVFACTQWRRQRFTSSSLFFQDLALPFKINENAEIQAGHNVHSRHPLSRLCFNLDQYFKSLPNKLLLSLKSGQNQSQSICIDQLRGKLVCSQEDAHPETYTHIV